MLCLGYVQVGNGGLLLSVQRSHFALWALLKSPLLIGTDLRVIHPDSLAILKVRSAGPSALACPALPLHYWPLTASPAMLSRSLTFQLVALAGA